MLHPLAASTNKTIVQPRKKKERKGKSLRREILTKSQKKAVSKASSPGNEGTVALPARADSALSDQQGNREIVEGLRMFMPKSSPGWAPWSNRMPAVQEHYRTHFADYTGVQMFHQKNLPYKLNQLLGLSPIVFTIAVLYGETWNDDQSVYHLPKPALMWLKSYVYESINTSLATAKNNISIDLITHVRCIAGYEACFDPNLTACRHHLKGAKILMNLYKGPGIYNYYDRNHMALTWQDRAICHLAGDQNFVWDPPTDAYWNPSSPLFLATVPTEQDLGHQRFRRMLVCSHLTPGTEIITLLHKLQKRLEKNSDSPEDQVKARRSLQLLEQEFLDLSPDRFDMVLIYKDPKYYQQTQACETLRRIGLLIIAAARQRHSPSNITSAQLEHCLNSLFLLNITKLIKHSPHCAFWMLCIGGPYATGYLRLRTIDWIISCVTRLGIRTWTEAQEMLENLLYYPEIQDSTGPLLWEECEKHVAWSVPPLPDRSLFKRSPT